MIEEDVADSLNRFQSISKTDLADITQALVERQEEVESGLAMIDEGVARLFGEIAEKSKDYKKMEKEWLFMLQDHYKSKYLDLLLTV